MKMSTRATKERLKTTREDQMKKSWEVYYGKKDTYVRKQWIFFLRKDTHLIIIYIELRRIEKLLL